jgi:hypothetical protein
MSNTAITDAGMSILSKRMLTQTGETSPAQPEPKYLGWGTGTTAFVHTQTALATPSSEARTAATTSTTTTTITNDTYQAVGTITSTQTQTITELGQFDASSVGNMLARWVFTGIAVNNNDSIQFTTQIQSS